MLFQFQTRRCLWAAWRGARWSCPATSPRPWPRTKCASCSGSRTTPPNQFTLMTREVLTTQYKIHPKQSSRSLEQLQLTSSPWHDHGQNRGTSYILYLPFRGNVQLLQTSVTNVTTVFRIPLVCVQCPPLILLSKEQYCLAESSVPSMKQVGHWDSQG